MSTTWTLPPLPTLPAQPTQPPMSCVACGETYGNNNHPFHNCTQTQLPFELDPSAQPLPNATDDEEREYIESLQPGERELRETMRGTVFEDAPPQACGICGFTECACAGFERMQEQLKEERATQLAQPFAPVPPPLPALPVVMSAEDTAAAKKRINPQDKGKRAEREVVKLLQGWIDAIHDTHKQPRIILQRNTLQAHLGGEDLFGLDGFAVEVKWQEVGYTEAFWTQAVRQAEARGGCVVPVLFWRVSRASWTVKVRFYAETPCQSYSVPVNASLSLKDFQEWFTRSYEAKFTNPAE